MRRRLDVELVRRHLAGDREEARRAVLAGKVLVGGSLASNPAHMVQDAEPVALRADDPRFVGRGGEKLQAALERFGLTAQGLRVLDGGASTGGFTDCLLVNGAVEVLAVDVGRAQLHQRLRADPRVRVMERTNLRHLDLGVARVDAAVADLSFISLTVVMDVLIRNVVAGGWLLLLVKPQFEARYDETSRGRGVIHDPAVWRRTLLEVIGSALALGAAMIGVMASPLRGAEGNIEFFVMLRTPDPNGSDPGAHVAADVERIVDAALRDAEGHL